MAGVMLFILTTVLAALTTVSGHSYHLGNCPNVESQQNFDMEKFLGKWYVVQKTSTGSKCLTETYVKSNETGKYVIRQVSEHLILGLTSLNHEYTYEGELTVPETSDPARMTVRFPLSVAGSASYIVFMTDYETYAGVFTCQKLGFAHRQSASILSRSPRLDKIYVDKIRNRLRDYGVDPYDLSLIEHSCNPPDEDTLDININPTTFTAGSVAGVVRKAGEKLGDGIEAAADGASSLYNRFHGSSNSNASVRRDREEVTNDRHNPRNDAEWLR
ncbi:apolipoprotein D [Cryptotermes secundus]|uniref:apolipoprotein D n=1 Tax=Cryptotermes secundus TaxID=105785 RepID=UPI000CD7BB17|nr:apolipoprotein D [Cryptotermes secundus]